MIDKRELLLASLDKQYFFAKGGKSEVVSSLCGLQAQFANNPGHALRIRADDFAGHTWQDGLVKTWTFRHTLHAVRADELGLFLSARGVPERWTDAWGLTPKAMARWSAFLLRCVREGVRDRAALKDACRKAGMTAGEMDCAFHGWGGLISEMCKRGLIAYAPGTAKRFVACDGLGLADCGQARATLLERYFATSGRRPSWIAPPFSASGKRRFSTNWRSTPCRSNRSNAKGWSIGISGRGTPRGTFRRAVSWPGSTS